MVLCVCQFSSLLFLYSSFFWVLFVPSLLKQVFQHGFTCELGFLWVVFFLCVCIFVAALIRATIWIHEINNLQTKCISFMHAVFQSNHSTVSFEVFISTSPWSSHMKLTFHEFCLMNLLSCSLVPVDFLYHNLIGTIIDDHFTLFQRNLYWVAFFKYIKVLYTAINDFNDHHLSEY